MNKADEVIYRSIDIMLHPKSICIIGANQQMSYGGRFLNNLVETKYAGKIYPINPKYKELMGVPCYPSVESLPEAPDLAGIIVPYEATKQVLEDCAKKGVKTAVVITGQFAELQTDERKGAQQWLKDFALRTNMRLCGPNCLGIANVKDNIWPSSATFKDIKNTIPGSLALISQSGASAFSPFLLRAQDRGIGFDYILSTGNEADLEAADFIRYCMRQPGIKAIIAYFEAIKDPDKFREVAKEALDRGKPIVALKIGRSAAGMKAALSHTASMTGSDKVVDALFKQFGITRVDDWDELLETGNMLAKSPPFKKETVGVMAHSGGVASLLSDKCEQALGMPQPSPATRKALNDILQDFGSPANPADITWHTGTEDLNVILKLMLEEENYGGLVLGTAGSDDQANRIINAANSSDKPVAMVWTASERATDGLKKLQASRIPMFYRSSNLLLGLRALVNYHHKLATWRNRTSSFEPSIKPVTIGKKGTLGLQEGMSLLVEFGIPAAKNAVAHSAKEAADIASNFGFPIVLKAQVPHKSDLGLVKVGLKSRSAVENAFRELKGKLETVKDKATADGILVQEMVGSGTEVIIGVKRDPQFGPTLLFGMGGTMTELLQDVSLRVCPVSRDDIREMFTEVKGFRLLTGFRGRPAGDIKALEDTLLNVSNLAVSLKSELLELDINPLIVLPEGKGVKAVDVLTVLG